MPSHTSIPATPRAHGDVTSQKLHNDETEREKEKYEVLAKRDALTGIANRRACSAHHAGASAACA